MAEIAHRTDVACGHKPRRFRRLGKLLLITGSVERLAQQDAWRFLERATYGPQCVERALVRRRWKQPLRCRWPRRPLHSAMRRPLPQVASACFGRPGAIEREVSCLPLAGRHQGRFAYRSRAMLHFPISPRSASQEIQRTIKALQRKLSGLDAFSGPKSGDVSDLVSAIRSPSVA